MTKVQAMKKIETTLKKSLKTLTKDINAILKDAKVWYCADDIIKSCDNLHKPSDRNGDQVIIDYLSTIMLGEKISATDIKKLWTKEDIAGED